jgi:hypothetical protein
MAVWHGCELERLPPELLSCIHPSERTLVMPHDLLVPALRLIVPTPTANALQAVFSCPTCKGGRTHRMPMAQPASSCRGDGRRCGCSALERGRVVWVLVTGACPVISPGTW